MSVLDLIRDVRNVRRLEKAGHVEELLEYATPTYYLGPGWWACRTARAAVVRCGVPALEPTLFRLVDYLNCTSESAKVRRGASGYLKASTQHGTVQILQREVYLH